MVRTLVVAANNMQSVFWVIQIQERVQALSDIGFFVSGSNEDADFRPYCRFRLIMVFIAKKGYQLPNLDGNVNHSYAQ
jgi:hypothetical protein